MLTIKDLKKSYGGRTLFEDASLQVNYGDKVALVGPNGAGKSTLFSLVLGNEEADEGNVERDEWTTVGFLPQEAEAKDMETVLDIATGRAGALGELEKKLKDLEEAGDVACIEYYEAQGKHDALNDPGFEAKCKKVLMGMGYKESEFDRPAKELSGGWVMRAHLARILAMEPDLLMLDEPTNHLDLQSLLWVQDYLAGYGGAVLMISHDRQFMDEIVKQVYEIDNKKVVPYKGNYSAYIKQKEENFERQHNAWKNQQKEISALQDFANRFRSVASKASQAQSKLKQIERMDIIEKPRAPKKPFRFQFPQPERGGQRSVILENIHFAYGDYKVYEGIDLVVERGDRTVLVGPNGAGKSTLIKLLAGDLEPQSGDRKLGHNAMLGYFSQHRSASLDPNNTVLEEVMGMSDAIKENEARAVLGSFMFRKEEIFKKTGVLSGGEKSRLNLVKFLVNPPNILLMDEPTTHLDILTVESLIMALEAYEGTLVFISHDVFFIRKLATRVLHINNGKIRAFAGGYDYYVEKMGGNDARGAITAS